MQLFCELHIICGQLLYHNVILLLFNVLFLLIELNYLVKELNVRTRTINYSIIEFFCKEGGFKLAETFTFGGSVGIETLIYSTWTVYIAITLIL